MSRDLIRRTFFCVLLVFAATARAESERPASPRFDRFAGIPGDVNTAGVEFGPSFTQDGRTMVFSSAREGQRFQELYSAEFKDGRWQNVRPITELNSPYNDETPFVTPDGKMLFFASDRDGSLEQPKDAQGRIRVSYDLYWSRRTESGWSPPTKVPGEVNTTRHERSPTYDVENGILYYNTWTFGTLSDARILRAEFRDGRFVSVQLLPKAINLGFRETAPMVSAYRSGLFFSSQRPGGFGGFDLYFVSYENGEYGAPVNLGPEINTPANEFFFSRVGTRLYFCSDRPGGRGRYDILTAALPTTREVVARVLDAETGKPLSARVIIAGKLEDGPPFEIEKSGDDQGRVRVEVAAGAKDVSVRATHDGYLPRLARGREDGSEQVLKLVPIRKDGSFEVRAVRFDFDSARIKTESHAYLNALADYLKGNKDRYRIIGHTDLHGSAEWNQALSLRRAQSVRAYLVERGLSRDRFEVAGAGMSRPVVPKRGRPHDALNRRTEFKRLPK